ncbi:hypothetical protein FXO38_35784 [Capsicum annuum]|nr:hypothetical protein FXO38_35784 [Capsicum annuum]KAF3673009.1 hypothetical protein FXO37_07209 [Capsicum annuum]
MLLAKNPSKKVDSGHIKMVADLYFFGGYPWGKESFGLTLCYLEKKIDLIKKKEAFVKRNNALYALYGFPWVFMVWIYEAFSSGKVCRWHTSKYDNIMEGGPFKYKGNSTKIVHPYLTLIIHGVEHRYIKIFNPYTDGVKDISIDALKTQLKDVTVLTSSAEVVDEDEDLDGHNYVPSPTCACDHVGSSGLKTTPDASNDDDLRDHKVVVTDIAAADVKAKEEKKKEETEEERAADEQDAKEEEEEKD